jgi:hypothetical protein
MANHEVPESRDEILKRFKALVVEQEKQASALVTRAEEAERARRRSQVDEAAAYTVESIVRGLAALQLEFGAELDAVSQRLESESQKLVILQQAIELENERLDTLHDTQVAAEALALLKAEQELQRKDFEEQSASTRKDHADAVAGQREDWAREQAEFEAGEAAYATQRDRDRAAAEELFAYETERARSREADEYETRKRLQERQLAETEAARAADRKAREAVLDANAEKIIALRQEVEVLPTRQEEAVKKAREEGISEAAEEARIAAELKEKEHESTLKVFELRVQTLESTIDKQIEQIQSLTEQLQVAANQSQDLAVKAIAGAARTPIA